MNFDLGQATAGLHALIVHFTQRLPYMGLAIIVFIAFYIAGLILRRLAARFTRRTRRHRSVGIVIGRRGQGVLVLLGLLIALAGRARRRVHRQRHHAARALVDSPAASF